MPTAFVSHSSEDAQFIERNILPTLKALGVEVWYSPISIHTAEEWERSIKRGLESSDWFVVTVSPHSAKSRWVRAETGWAFNNRDGRIVPILIGQCNPYDLHMLLAELQFADFRRDPRKGEQELRSLFDRHGADSGRPIGTPAWGATLLSMSHHWRHWRTPKYR